MTTTPMTGKEESISDKFVRIVFAVIVPVQIICMIVIAAVSEDSHKVFGIGIMFVSTLVNVFLYMLVSRVQSKNRSELLTIPQKTPKVNR